MTDGSRIADNRIEVHIGIDDTDSPLGGCTTHVAACFVQQLVNDSRLNAKSQLIDYPNLIRLNPNIPYRTRGNGAVAIRLLTESTVLENLFRLICNLIEELADLDHPNTQPGIVIYKGAPPSDIIAFGRQSLHDVISSRRTNDLLRRHQINILEKGYKGARGLTGALAAIGNILLDQDYTFELIAYRKPKNYGKKRRIDKESVYAMNKATFPDTFANIDPLTNEILITPHGPDPVLYGIRGNSPKVVYAAHKMIISQEP
ncbi:MAG: TiaS agmantine-binding domain-containing protein, partial [Candidatus Ranarchaeia archaeon]